MPPLIVDTDTILSASQTVEGIHIRAGATLTFDPEQTIVVESRGNVVVEGILRMRPRKAATVHTLRLAGTREADFVGGHTHIPLESDRGVWIFGEGQLDLQGHSKTAWTREPASAVGWDGSDELVVTPTAPGDYTGFAPYRVGDPVPIGALGLPAEVLNLMHNVVVEGEPTGRSHIFIQSQVPQYVRYVTVRHMGPRQTVAGKRYTEGVRGRYPIHFHMCGAGSRGSRLEGVLVYQSGNRAFVPHASHGIVFQNCIAYNIWEEPFWWDQAMEMDKSDAIVWKNCLAALIQEDPPYRGFRLSAFVLA
jgi:hypothetical protein